MILKDYFTEFQTAELFGRSIAWLRLLRKRGNGPVYYKIGKKVYYKPHDIREWVDGQARYPRNYKLDK